jgi:hypothetical protein
MTVSHPQNLLSERGKTHGSWSTNAACSQKIKEVLHGSAGWSRLSPEQREALDMAACKIGRILAGNPNFKDHWVDAAGYFQLVANVLPSE